MYGDINFKSWSQCNSLSLRFNSLPCTSWKVMAETLRCNPVPESIVGNESNIIPLWLFPLPLLRQLTHSKLYLAISCHPEYQISMTEN